MGDVVGLAEGVQLVAYDGNTDGVSSLGDLDGDFEIGITLGIADGVLVAKVLRMIEGDLLGRAEGFLDGVLVEETDGVLDGLLLRRDDGNLEGL